jgi:hypothetical protein
LLAVSKAASEHQAEVTSMKVEIINGNLVITLPINPHPEPSATGKTLVVCSSHGNKVTDAKVNGKPVTVGVNAYISR